MPRFVLLFQLHRLDNLVILFENLDLFRFLKFNANSLGAY